MARTLEWSAAGWVALGFGASVAAQRRQEVVAVGPIEALTTGDRLRPAGLPKLLTETTLVDGWPTHGRPAAPTGRAAEAVDDADAGRRGNDLRRVPVAATGSHSDRVGVSSQRRTGGVVTTADLPVVIRDNEAGVSAIARNALIGPLLRSAHGAHKIHYVNSAGTGSP